MGVAVFGDFLDFENLYDALHEVVGDEGEYPAYELARLRVLGVCYDFRHALMGNREIEFVDNGMDEEKKKRLSVLFPDKNLYLKINILWPELLFVTMVLNDFVREYAQKKTNRSYDYFQDKQIIWNKSVAQIRVFQSCIQVCIQETIPETLFSRMMNTLHKKYTYNGFGNYITQYVDILNEKFIGMDKAKRQKNISIMAKRLVEQGNEYQRVKRDVIHAAEIHQCEVENIDVGADYPDEIDW